MITHKQFKAKMLKRTGVRQARREQALEFALIRAVIDARLRKGMTQARLARKVGTKQSAIARLEAGRANPTLDFIQRLSKALDLDLVIAARRS